MYGKRSKSPTIACPRARLSAKIGAMEPDTPQIAPLSADMTHCVLLHFGLPTDAPPNLNTLRLLLERYTRAVPWESASRIMRRAQYADAADCLLLGDAFWESHFKLGSGGTCYESNYAFFGLLRRLGFEGYLTLNDMGTAIGCHSAIIILLQGRKVVVDVGFPLHAILPLADGRESTAESPFMRYTAKPLGDRRFEIWRSLPRDERVFQLNDIAIGEVDYREMTLHDYRHNGGQFLNEVVIHKVIDGQLWRFNSDERPLRLQQFVDGERHDRRFGDDPAGEVAEKFGMARAVVAEALASLNIGQRLGGRATQWVAPTTP